MFMLDSCLRDHNPAQTIALFTIFSALKSGKPGCATLIKARYYSILAPLGTGR